MSAGREPPIAGASHRPAIFIDKDGTLIADVPYNVDPALLRFMPAAGEALAALSAAGFALVLITNQSGIALGFFSEQQFARLAQALRRRLLDEAGVVLDGVYHCPHAPGPDGQPRCACRKPAGGMLLRAAQALRLDLRRSWMVGDTLDDVEAGHRAGCRGVLFDSGGETLWQRSPLRWPEAQLPDWRAVAELILADARAQGGAAAAAIPFVPGMRPQGEPA